jgi:ribulose-phosphate 3-epimerase
MADVPKTLIAPSILSADFARLGEEVRAACAAGADLIHCDVMDGRFVPNLTFGPSVLAAVKPSATVPVDVHLMIVEPERWLEAWAEAGADWLSVHVEACTHLHRTLARIRELGLAAGAVLNPATHEHAVEHVLELCDHVLVMTVNPGFGGQRFIEGGLRKIEAIAGMAARRGLAPRIEVDGGVQPDTLRRARDAGASVFVAGSAVFGRGGEGEAAYRTRIAALREA